MGNKVIKSAEDIFDQYALMYAEKYMDVEQYHDSLDIFLSALPSKKSEVLELACGPGNITQYLLDQNPELQILATDLSPAMLKIAEENNPDARTKLLDCRSIRQLGKTFDAIICGFGLPYISKEEAIQLIVDASNSLHEDGLLYLSTMEDDYSKSGFKGSSTNPNEGLHMYYHESGYIVEAFEANKFKIVDLSRVKYPDDRGKDVTDMIVIGKKLFI